MHQLSRRDFAKAMAASLVVAGADASYAWGRGDKDYYYLVAADPQLWWKADDARIWHDVIAMANRLKPDFLFVCGDMLSLPNEPEKLDLKRAEKMAEAYLDAAAGLDKKIPLHHVAGNHDVCRFPTSATMKWYQERFGEPWYSFVHKKSLFIVIEANTLIQPKAVKKKAEEQMAWLKNLLKSSAKKGYQHRTVYMHQPLFVRSVDEQDSYHNFPRKLRKELLDLFAAHDVEMGFAGHLHANAYGKVKDFEMITTASCCHSGPRKSPMGLRIVHVTEKRIYDKFYSLADMPEKLSDMRIAKKG